ncbi:MAG TPA: hypothetical protein VED00_00085 [archaeon]|nr:hypothetical protein [archaeon]
MNFADWIRRREIYRKLKLIRLPHVRGVKAPTIIVFLALVVIAIFFLSGGIYNYVEFTAGMLFFVTQYGNQSVFYYPKDISAQLLGESLLAMLFYGVGMVGCYVAFLSTRYAYRRRQAWILLSLGITMIVMAYFGFQILFNLKMG